MCFEIVLARFNSFLNFFLKIRFWRLLKAKVLLIPEINFEKSGKFWRLAFENPARSCDSICQPQISCKVCYKVSLSFMVWLIKRGCLKLFSPFNEFMLANLANFAICNLNFILHRVHRSGESESHIANIIAWTATLANNSGNCSSFRSKRVREVWKAANNCSKFGFRGQRVVL